MDRQKLPLLLTFLSGIILVLFSHILSLISYNFYYQLEKLLSYKLLSSLFMVLILTVIYIMFYYRSIIKNLKNEVNQISNHLNKKLTFIHRFGVSWDEDEHPYCQKCDSLLVDYVSGKNNQYVNPHFRCHKCGHKNYLMHNDSTITYEQAKAELILSKES